MYLQLRTSPQKLLLCNGLLIFSSGVSGSKIELRANYTRLLSRPQWVLYQYHVDFKPPMESRRMRSALLYNHEELLGKARTFDGTILFLPHRLQNTVNDCILSAVALLFF